MKNFKVNSSTGINLPIGNLISIIGACLVAAWFGFSIIERVNKLETQTVLMEKDMEEAVWNTLDTNKNKKKKKKKKKKLNVQ